jgi:hypothetical protein
MAAIVANDSDRCFHNPCAERKSGKPDSVLMPAPVKTTTFEAVSQLEAISTINRSDIYILLKGTYKWTMLSPTTFSLNNQQAANGDSGQP